MAVKTYKITVGKVYELSTGKECTNPTIILESVETALLKCIDKETNTYEVQTLEGTLDNCLTFQISCDTCEDCPPQYITKCLCNTSDDCSACTHCNGDECVDSCEGKLCDEDKKLCVDCLKDTDCEGNEVCTNGVCDCPYGLPFKTELGCVECIDTTDCPSGKTCVSGTCEEIDCAGGILDPETFECVECINTSHCGDNQSCVNKTCVCSSGYISVAGECVPQPECTYDTDCADCQYCNEGDCAEQLCPDGLICNGGECEPDGCAEPPTDLLKFEWVEGTLQSNGDSKGVLSGSSSNTDIDVYNYSVDKKFDFSVSGASMISGGQWFYSESLEGGFQPVTGTNTSLSLSHGDSTLGTNYLGYIVKYVGGCGRIIYFKVQNDTFDATQDGWTSSTYGSYDPTGTYSGDVGYLKLCLSDSTSYVFSSTSSLVSSNTLEQDLSVSFSEVLDNGKCLKVVTNGCGAWEGILNVSCGEKTAELPTEVLNIDWRCCDANTLTVETCWSTGEPCDKEPCILPIKVSQIDLDLYHASPEYTTCIDSFEELYTLEGIQWTAGQNPTSGANDISFIETSSHATLDYTQGGCIGFSGDTKCLNLTASECIDECINSNLPPEITSFTFDETTQTFSGQVEVGNEASLYPSIVLELDGNTLTTADYTIAAGILTFTGYSIPTVEVKNYVLNVTMDNTCEGGATDSFTVFSSDIELPCVPSGIQPTITVTCVEDSKVSFTVDYPNGLVNPTITVDTVALTSSDYIANTSSTGTTVTVIDYPITDESNIVISATGDDNCMTTISASDLTNCPPATISNTSETCEQKIVIQDSEIQILPNATWELNWDLMSDCEGLMESGTETGGGICMDVTIPFNFSEFQDEDVKTIRVYDTLNGVMVNVPIPKVPFTPPFDFCGSPAHIQYAEDLETQINAAIAGQISIGNLPNL